MYTYTYTHTHTYTHIKYTHMFLQKEVLPQFGFFGTVKLTMQLLTPPIPENQEWCFIKMQFQNPLPFFLFKKRLTKLFFQSQET